MCSNSMHSRQFAADKRRFIILNAHIFAACLLPRMDSAFEGENMATFLPKLQMLDRAAIYRKVTESNCFVRKMLGTVLRNPFENKMNYSTRDYFLLQYSLLFTNKTGVKMLFLVPRGVSYFFFFFAQRGLSSEVVLIQKAVTFDFVILEFFRYGLKPETTVSSPFSSSSVMKCNSQAESFSILNSQPTLQQILKAVRHQCDVFDAESINTHECFVQ